jgi:anti-sigma factor RsiW
MAQDSAERRFEENIALYLNGTLPPDEQAFIERYLREHPDAQSERVYWTELRAALNEAANDAAPDIGLAKLQQRMRGAAQSKSQSPVPNARATTPAPSDSWWQRFADRLRPLATPQALAFASVLVIAQAAALLALISAREPFDEAVTTRSLGNRAQPAAIVSVKFAANTSMDALTQLLADLDARIIEGPIESGRYVIALRPAAKDSALEKLKASGMAQDIVTLPSPEPKR